MLHVRKQFTLYIHLGATADTHPPLPGIQKIRNVLKPFDVEFGPLISEIDAREKVIRDCADNATMVRIKSKFNGS